MAIDDSRHLAEADLIETLYGDPIREPKVKASRQLLVTSLLLIAVVKFGAVIDSTSLFPLKFKEPDVLPTALGVTVILLIFNFVPRVLTDFGLFVEGERLISRFIWRAKEEAAMAVARDIDDGVYNYPEEEGDFDSDPWWETVDKVRQAAAKAEETINARLGRRTFIRWVRHFRAFGEVLVPLAFAFFGLYLAAPLRWPS